MSIPLAILVVSLCHQTGFLSVIMTSYQDERVFPFERKATAINIMVLVGKFVTTGASFVNELAEPMPLIVLLVLTAIWLALSFLFPAKEQLD